jgi:hypothetical protein
MVAIPLFAPAWSFGGVQPEPIWALASVLLATTLFFCALGVFFGALLPGALAAALFAQAAALFLLFGTLGLHLAFVILGGNNSLKLLLWLNPFLALLSGGGTVTEAFARQAPGAIRGVLSVPTAIWAPGLLLPAWAIASVAWTFLSIGLIFAASVVIDPCHPLKPRYRS